MPFLQWLGKLALGFLFEKLGELVKFLVDKIKEKIARQKKDDQIQRDAEQSVDPLKKAEGAKEVDRAIDQALDHF